MDEHKVACPVHLDKIRVNYQLILRASGKYDEAVSFRNAERQAHSIVHEAAIIRRLSAAISSKTEMRTSGMAPFHVMMLRRALIYGLCIVALIPPFVRL